ncbi:24593_t:CDS:2 [Entrophospora sp. SA101]|nr:24593_t:CDS:2 [Entrophospora sp. SA101]
MNNLYKHALKQEQGIRQELEKFESGDVSVGLQGQISASLTALKRTIEDYDVQAKREVILVKQNKAFAYELLKIYMRVNISKLREDYSEMNFQFERLKQREANKITENNRSELLGRRHNTNTPEHPYQNNINNHVNNNMTREQHALREHEFINDTETKLDEYIAHGREVLHNIYDQNNILKNAQRKMLDAANTLGLSRNVIQYIERRMSQDKWNPISIGSE